MIKAAKLTRENLTDFVEMHDDILDPEILSAELEEAECWSTDVYLVIAGESRHKNYVVTFHHTADFESTWKFVGSEVPNQFVEIERI